MHLADGKTSQTYDAITTKARSARGQRRIPNRRPSSNSLSFKFVAGSLRLGILLVILVKTAVEHDGRRQVANNRVVVRLLGLVVEVKGAQRLDVVCRDDGNADLSLFVVDQLAEPCKRSRSRFSRETSKTSACPHAQI